MNYFKKVLFIIFSIFFIFILLFLNSCAINPLYLKSPEKLEKFAKKNPLLPYYYISELKFDGIVVTNKEVMGVTLPPLNISFDYIKDKTLKLNLNLNILFKTVSFAEVYFDFVKMKGYIKSSYSLYYKNIDEKYLSSISPYLNKILLIKGINTLFLLFDKSQKELLNNNEIIVSQFFKYYKQDKFVSKIGFEIPQIQVEVDYKNLKMVDSLLKYPFYIEGTYYKNRIEDINFKIAIKNLEVKYNFNE